MPPEFLERLQGILGNFFSRRLGEDPPAISPAAETQTPSLTADFPPPMSQDATRIEDISPFEIALMERELMALEPMAQDATFVDPEAGESLLGQLPQEIAGLIERVDESPFGSFLRGELPYQQRMAESPVGRFLEPINELIDRPETQIVVGMMGPTPSIINPNLVKRANMGQVGLFKTQARSGRVQPTSNPYDMVPVDARIGGIVIETPVGPANTPQLRRAAQNGFTTDAYHGTKVSEIFEGIATPGTVRGTDRGGVFYDWTHFGTPEAAWTRLGGRKVGMPDSPLVHLADSRIMPAKLRGPFLQTTDDGANVGSRILSQVKLSNVLDEHELIVLEDMLMRSLSGFKGAVGSMLEARGIRGFRYLNAHEDIGSISYVIFSPRNTRSLWAEFDLDRLQEAGMMLGTGGAALGAQQFLQEQESQPLSVGAMQ